MNLTWDIIKKLWDDGKSLKGEVQANFDYWDGKYEAPADSLFRDQKKTSCNVCKEIAETKLNSTLDSPFTIAVVPKIGAFSDMNTIQDQNDYADVLHGEVQNVLYNNDWDTIKEKVCRWGIIKVGASQTFIDDNGDIKIDVVDPRNIKIDKTAKSTKELTFIAYETELNPDVAKNKYAKNPDGTFNLEKCAIIDKLAGLKTDYAKGKKKGMVATQNTQTNTADLAFAREREVSAGKVIKLICMYLLDDSVYSPDRFDDKEKEIEKQELQAKYPNGRYVVFNDNEQYKLIFEDKAAPEAFKNLGNIDFFNSNEFDSLIGRGEIADIIPIQDRINGTLLKIRSLVATQINTIVLDEGVSADVQESAFVNHAVVFIPGIGNDGGKAPGILNNGAIEEAMKLTDYISSLKQDAYNIARLNETMINGVRQVGTNSGEQVEQLNESPMSSIRAIQRNFKSFIINIGEKILNLIQEYYTTQRMIELSTGIYKNNIEVKYAKFKAEGDNRWIEMLDKAGKIVQQIKVNKDWKFRVEVVAGTEIPRSRRENSMLIERLYNSGQLGDPNDLDIREQYLKSLDVPNYRAFIQVQKRKQEELMKNPPQIKVEDVMQDPNLSKATSDFIKVLEFNSAARDKVLEILGFSPEESGTDTLETAPVQSVASKADIKEVTALEPNNASENPEKQANAQDLAGAMIDKEKEHGVSGGFDSGLQAIPNI